MSVALAITFLALFGGVSRANSAPPLDTFILYLAPEDFEPIVGDIVNITCVFKNYLNVTETLYNVTLEFNIDEELNITNFYNLPDSVVDGYNYTDYMLNITNTDPLFYWSSESINATWKTIDQNQEEFFWFKVNCTQVGTYSFDDMTLTYRFINETELTHDGDTFSLTVSDIPITPVVPVPPRGELYWYWWLAGGALIAIPVIVIIITRLTLWKR
jgi:hypothetical protein